MRDLISEEERAENVYENIFLTIMSQMRRFSYMPLFEFLFAIRVG